MRDVAAQLLMEVDDIDSTIPIQGVAKNDSIERIDWFARAIAARCDMLIFTEMVRPQFLPPTILDVAVLCVSG